MRAHLTDITVRSLKPTDRQEKVWDTQTPGFGVRINGRTKSWIVMYGRKRQLKTLGRYPDMPLAKARQEAKRLLAAPETPDLKTTTFQDAVDEFLRTYSAHHHKERTRRETERLLRKHYIPQVGHRSLKQLTFQDLRTISDSLLATPSEASHAFRAARVFLNWAKANQYVEVNPLAGVPLPTKEKTRDRVLTPHEIQALWQTADGLYGDIWKLLLLTAQRKMQISALKWDWIDGDTINFPADIMKSGRAHTIPIGSQTTSILEHQTRNGRYVFPGRWDKDSHFVGWQKLKVKHDARAGVSGYTLHDLRRTATSLHAEIGTPIHVNEKLIDHQGTLSGVVGIYNRYSYLPEMREAVHRYEDFIRSLVGS